MAWQDDDEKESVARAIERRRSRGEALVPVVPEGKASKLAQQFWGIAWQHHLETYADYHSRLPKSRTMLRQGKVMDLAIRPGEITSVVAGTALHDVIVKIAPLDPEAWQALCAACKGRVGSLLDLLSGTLGDEVMRIVTSPEHSLFPARRDIRILCDCTDDSDLCPHGAATLYAAGLQFDANPGLFFQLRAVQAADLVDEASRSLKPAISEEGSALIPADDLSAVFGIEFSEPARPE
jgi:uncharacterized Zn finger protein